MSSPSAVESRSDDAALVDRIARRDGSALAEVYDRHAGTVVSLARRVMHDRTAAEDVAQQVFLRLWERPLRFDSTRGSLRTFLCTECHHRCVDLLRADGARRRRTTFEAVSDPYEDPTAADGLAQGVATRVGLAVQSLPPFERNAIELAYFDGRTYREVATILGSPEGTTKTRIRTGLRRMRTELTDLEFAGRAG